MLRHLKILYKSAAISIAAVCGVIGLAAPTHAAGSYNLLQNGSFELTRSGSTTMADCWQTGSTGTNTATYSRISIPSSSSSITNTNTFTVRGGAHAQEVNISSYSSGTRKIVSTQNTTCAPTATPGYSYNMSAWMKGSGSARLVAYYYNGTSWTVLGNGPVVNLTGAWTQYHYTTDVLPAGATHLSVGVSLQSIGTMTVDTVTLEKNLVNNPSVELETTGVPTCMQRGSAGTNTGGWTRNTTDKRSFAYSEQVDITAYTSGDRKVVTKQDTGACAPAVTSGHTYKTSVWLKGSGTARMVVFTRNTSGTWSYWNQSSAVTLSSTWQKVSYTTPAVPSGTTHISFGPLLQSVGTMLIDDFELTDTELAFDNFSAGANGGNNLITNEFAYNNQALATSVFDDMWGMESGSLFYNSTYGAAATNTPDDCSSLTTSPNATSSNCNNNQQMRVWTHEVSYGDTKTTFNRVINGQTSSAQVPSVAWDGIHIFARKQNEHHLYYGSVDRRDGSLAIKKKCPGKDINNNHSNGGVYHQIAGAGSNAYPIQVGVSDTVGFSAVNTAGGTVTLTMYRNGTPVLSVVDDGTKSTNPNATECAPITYPGGTGIRGDNTNFRFDDFKVERL